jgi:PKD repeat protein
MKKRMVITGVVLLCLLLLSGCTEQTATQQTPQPSLITNKAPKIEECQVDYFDRNNPATVFFVGAASDIDGTVVLYSWNISDGFTSNEQSFVHTFSHPGVYQARLTVMDDKGAINSTSIAVYVYDTMNDTQQRDETRIIGQWENMEGTFVEFTSDGSYVVPQDQIHDRYWFSQGGLYIHSTRNNETVRYEYSFQGDNTLVFSQAGYAPTSLDTWMRVH